MQAPFIAIRCHKQWELLHSAVRDMAHRARSHVLAGDPSGLEGRRRWAARLGATWQRKAEALLFAIYTIFSDTRRIRDALLSRTPRNF